MKILFFDIDGTLVGKDKKISVKVQQAIQSARKRGHLAILCTGRSRNYIQHILDLGFDGCISNAGAYIEYDHNKIEASYIEPSLVRKVEEIFDELDIAYDHECEQIDYVKDKMILDMFDDQDSEIKQAKIQQFLKENKVLPLQEYKGEAVLKISYSCETQNQINALKEKLSDSFDIMVNPAFSKFCGDLMPKNTNKGTAIVKLINYLGLDIHDTIGFGDSMNDKDMLKVCEEAVVMQNGDEEIKKLADTICESVEEDGIYYELLRRKFIE